MKKVILFAAALMAGASFYGYARYQAIAEKPGFQKLYQEEGSPAAARAATAIEQLQPLKESGAIAVILTPKQKIQLKEKKLNLKSFSRAALKEEAVEAEMDEKKRN